MRVRVLYFASVRELLGRAEEWLELPQDVASVADLSTHLERRYPALAGKLVGVRFAVNESFATKAQGIADLDTVAVIPPVAGG